MEKEKKPGILNYLMPVLLIGAGSLHVARHGIDAWGLIPVFLGSFGLYMALFNHALLQRVELLIIKLWYPIGQFITIVLMTITFYLIFAPVGLFLRLFKKDILDKKFKTDHLSYWKTREGPSNYTQQF